MRIGLTEHVGELLARDKPRIEDGASPNVDRDEQHVQVCARLEGLGPHERHHAVVLDVLAVTHPRFDLHRQRRSVVAPVKNQVNSLVVDHRRRDVEFAARTEDARSGDEIFNRLAHTPGASALAEVAIVIFAGRHAKNIWPYKMRNATTTATDLMPGTEPNSYPGMAQCAA